MEQKNKPTPEEVIKQYARDPKLNWPELVNTYIAWSGCSEKLEGGEVTDAKLKASFKKFWHEIEGTGVSLYNQIKSDTMNAYKERLGL